MPRNLLSYETALAEIHSNLEELISAKNTTVVLIDGRAGAGKSKFSKELAELVFQSERQLPKVVQMDQLYPGWDGLRAGSAYLNQAILRPVAAGRQANWQIWDWGMGERGAANEPANGWRSFDGGNLLLVEGCGSVSVSSSEIADLSIWIESDARSRKARFSRRDQGQFDPYWESWAIQEDEFYQQENSSDRCDIWVEN